MNPMIEKQYPILELYQGMRGELFGVINDEDLSYAPPNCPSLGALCVQIGEWEQSYVDSFIDFKQDFENRNPDKSLLKSCEKLQAWYGELDAKLRAAVEALSEEDIENKVVDKGSWTASLTWNLDIYKECLIIFYSKCWVYLKMMGRELPKGWEHWLS